MSDGPPPPPPPCPARISVDRTIPASLHLGRKAVPVLWALMRCHRLTRWIREIFAVCPSRNPIPELFGWKDFFESQRKYPKVGILAGGKFYDSYGKPTKLVESLRKVHDSAKKDGVEVPHARMPP